MSNLVQLIKRHERYLMLSRIDAGAVKDSRQNLTMI